MAYPVIKIYDHTNQMYVDTTGEGGSYSCTVTIPANTTTEPKTYEYEVYLNEEATGSKTTVTVAAQEEPEVTYKVDSVSAEPNSLTSEGGEVTITVTVSEDTKE